eukprot:scpid109495/ scgid2746/ 
MGLEGRCHTPVFRYRPSPFCHPPPFCHPLSPEAVITPTPIFHFFVIQQLYSNNSVNTAHTNKQNVFLRCYSFEDFNTGQRKNQVYLHLTCVAWWCMIIILWHTAHRDAAMKKKKFACPRYNQLYNCVEK